MKKPSINHGADSTIATETVLQTFEVNCIVSLINKTPRSTERDIVDVKRRSSLTERRMQMTVINVDGATESPFGNWMTAAVRSIQRRPLRRDNAIAATAQAEVE